MAAKVWQVAVHQDWSGKPMVNVVYVRDGSGVDDQDQIGGFVMDAWCATDCFADIVQTVDIDYSHVVVRNITDNLSGVEIPWAGSLSSGSVNTETVPPSIAICYTLKTGVAGRSRRGRLFIGGVTHGLYASGQTSWSLGGSPGSTIKNAGQVFRDELDNSGLSLVVWSRVLSEATIVTDVTMDSGLASQRPRAHRFALP